MQWRVGEVDDVGILDSAEAGFEDGTLCSDVVPVGRGIGEPQNGVAACHDWVEDCGDEICRGEP